MPTYNLRPTTSTHPVKPVEDNYGFFTMDFDLDFQKIRDSNGDRIQLAAGDILNLAPISAGWAAALFPLLVSQVIVPEGGTCTFNIGDNAAANTFTATTAINGNAAANTYCEGTPVGTKAYTANDILKLTVATGTLRNARIKLSLLFGTNIGPLTRGL